MPYTFVIFLSKDIFVASDFRHKKLMPISSSKSIFSILTSTYTYQRNPPQKEILLFSTVLSQNVSIFRFFFSFMLHKLKEQSNL